MIISCDYVKHKEEKNEFRLDSNDLGVFICDGESNVDGYNRNS